jgi:hypothetical protein
MKFGELKSIGHNVAHSLASGIGLLIGVYDFDIFEDAVVAPDGFITVDLLDGSVTGATPSPRLAHVTVLYWDALPRLCLRHGVDVAAFATLTVRFGTDSRYGRHFTVTVEDRNGRRSTDRYWANGGRRVGKRR